MSVGLRLAVYIEAEATIGKAWRSRRFLGLGVVFPQAPDQLLVADFGGCRLGAIEGADHACPNDRFHSRGEPLAVAGLIDRQGLVQLDDDVDRPHPERSPEMRDELHVPVPGEEWARLAPHRHAMQADIGD